MRVAVHRSKTPVNVLWDMSDQQRTTSKPIGLWYASPGVWLSAERAFGWAPVQYSYKFRVDYAMVRRVSGIQSLKRFTREFGVRDGESVEWGRVAEVYAGVEISPYVGMDPDTLWNHYAWYGGWDVASGCIWDPVAVKDWRQA